ncbi:MAG: PilN domain-containing protein [Methylococcaceae bacterium]|nr:PilN domain-containing protein [Methylococcaceae bacterium]
MIQQINLYQNGGTGNSHALLNPYLLIIIAACLGLVIVSGLELNERSDNQAERQQLQAQMLEAQAQLKKLQAQYPSQQIDSLLNQELQQTQGVYQSLSRIMELLADNQSDQSLGFSRYLSALAEQANADVWLTGIRINSETDSLSLQGSTFKPEQIPALLQRLQNTSAFKGRHFARLSIQQAPQTAEQVDFSVSSSLKPETEASDDRKH